VKNIHLRDAHNITIMDASIQNIFADTWFNDNIRYGNHDGVNCGIGFFQNLCAMLITTSFTESTYQNTFIDMSQSNCLWTFYGNAVTATNYNTFWPNVNQNAFNGFQQSTVDWDMLNNYFLWFQRGNTFWHFFQNNTVMISKQLHENTFWPRIGFAWANTFNGNMERNTFLWDAYSNTFNDNQYQNVFGYTFVNNTFNPGGSMQQCTTEYAFQSNIISGTIERCDFWRIFMQNTIPSFSPESTRDCKFWPTIQNKDFTPSTQLIGYYTKNILMSSDNISLFCTYIDGAGNTVVVDALT
jgi:hypothetical protein